ncbi:MAG TPA: HEAT repeat domain-containing protein, partial [Vicinamibacteria bacterium]
MPIVPSRSRRIQELLGRLASPLAAERDSAVAGLTLLGPRVLEPLRAFLPGAARPARLAAVEVLERIEDRGALPLLLELSRDGDEAVSRRAIQAAGAIPDPRAVSGLAALVAPPAPAQRRSAAARALARLARGRVEALDVLVARLLDEREEAGL